MAKIAILPTSKPLRAEVVKRGKRRQTLNGRVIGDLAAHYDVIIIGSTASDQFYEYVYNHLPLQQRSRLRLYGRSFFANQPTEDSSDGINDPRTVGCMEILTETHIMFETLRKTMGPDLLPRMEHFSWENMEEFILDDRVEVLKSADDIPH